MPRALRVDCPHCGEKNSLFRVLFHVTGVHLRCKSCHRSVRVVETVSGVFVTFLAFALAYGVAFWWLSGVWPPETWTRWIDPIYVVGLPLLPGVVGAMLALVLATVRQRDGGTDGAAVPHGVRRGLHVRARVGGGTVAVLVGGGASAAHRRADAVARHAGQAGRSRDPGIGGLEVHGARRQGAHDRRAEGAAGVPAAVALGRAGGRRRARQCEAVAAGGVAGVVRAGRRWRRERGPALRQRARAGVAGTACRPSRCRQGSRRSDRRR